MSLLKPMLFPMKRAAGMIPYCTLPAPLFRARQAQIACLNRRVLGFVAGLVVHRLNKKAFATVFFLYVELAAWYPSMGDPYTWDCQPWRPAGSDPYMWEQADAAASYADGTLKPRLTGVRRPGILRVVRLKFLSF